MTSLYSLRSTPAQGEYTILKLSEDYDVESIYALSTASCTCPAGARPKCKHRRMLPLFLQHSHVDDGWFLDWDTRLWRHPPSGIEGLADTTILGNADQAAAIAARLAPALASEAAYGTSPTLSATQDIKAINQLPPAERAAGNREFVEGQLREQGLLPPIPGGPLASPAEPTADAPAPTLASAAMGVEGRAEPPAATGGLRRRRI